MVGFVASINSIRARYYSHVIEQRTHHDLISGLKQSMQGMRLRLCDDGRIIHHCAGPYSCPTKIPSTEWNAASESHCLSWWCERFSVVGEWSTVDCQYWTTCVRKYKKAMSKPLLLSRESNYRSLAVQNWRWSWWRSTEAPDSSLVILATVVSYSIPCPALLSIMPWPIRMTYSSTDWSLRFWEWYDFYLMWQMTRQWTVAPTHFNIIWDQVGSVFSSRPGDQVREKDALFFVLD